MYPGGCCAVTEEAKTYIEAQADARVSSATDEEEKHCAILKVASELEIFTEDMPDKCGKYSHPPQ